MGVSLKDLTPRMKRPVRSIRLCLKLDLWTQRDALAKQLDELRAQNPGKMGDAEGVHAIAEQLRAVEQEMADAAETVEFRGISTYQLNEIQARFPAKDGRSGWDVNAGAAALLAACAVEPITEADARAFLEAAHQGIADEMVGAAWLATTGSSDVPFSARASELIRATGSK